MFVRMTVPRPMPTLGWEFTSVSNASATRPLGTSGTERLHFLLAIACSCCGQFSIAKQPHAIGTTNNSLKRGTFDGDGHCCGNRAATPVEETFNVLIHVRKDVAFLAAH
jgi:hypothetical protein